MAYRLSMRVSTTLLCAQKQKQLRSLGGYASRFLELRSQRLTTRRPRPIRRAPERLRRRSGRLSSSMLQRAPRRASSPRWACGTLRLAHRPPLRREPVHLRPLHRRLLRPQRRLLLITTLVVIAVVAPRATGAGRRGTSRGIARISDLEGKERGRRRGAEIGVMIMTPTRSDRSSLFPMHMAAQLSDESRWRA